VGETDEFAKDGDDIQGMQGMTGPGAGVPEEDASAGGPSVPPGGAAPPRQEHPDAAYGNTPPAAPEQSGQAPGHPVPPHQTAASAPLPHPPTPPSPPSAATALPGRVPWWKRPAFLAGAGIVVVILIIAGAAGGGKQKTGDSGAAGVEAVDSADAKKLEITLSTPTGQVLGTPALTLEGTTEPGATVTVKGCANAPVKVQAGEDGKFSAAVVLAEGANFLMVSCEKEGRKGDADLVCTYKVDPAEYKAQCQPVEFRVLEKNPDALKGQKYYAMGQVAQIMEGSLQTDIRMNVTRDKWGYWDDTIYVTYPGPVPDAFEDSIIEIWGEIQGSYTYTSTAGWKITLPLIKAKYIEVVQQ